MFGCPVYVLDSSLKMFSLFHVWMSEYEMRITLVYPNNMHPMWSSYSIFILATLAHNSTSHSMKTSRQNPLFAPALNLKAGNDYLSIVASSISMTPIKSSTTPKCGQTLNWKAALSSRCQKKIIMLIWQHRNQALLLPQSWRLYPLLMLMIPLAQRI